MSKARRRLFVFVAGLFLLFVVLEISLRIVGSIYAHLAEPEIAKKSDKHTTILSVGDSVTFGLGAEREFSYPVQLEKLLNKPGLQKQYRVINRGVPGQNSTKLLLNIERQLKQIQPDIVTILIGAQNLSNYFGYRDYLKNTNQHRDLKRDIHDRLDSIKIYKLTRLLIIELFKGFQWISGPGKNLAVVPVQRDLEKDEDQSQQQITPDSVKDCFAVVQLTRQGRYDAALNAINGIIKNKRANASCFYLAGKIYRERRQYDKAIEWFKNGIGNDPGHFLNYDGIGQSYFEQFLLEKAMYWWKRGFEHARSSTLRLNSYKSIVEAFRLTENVPEAIEFLQEEVKRRRYTNNEMYTMARETLQILQNRAIDREIHRWIETDVRRIVNICMQHNARVVLQGYPYEPQIEFIYKKVAADMVVPLVEHLPTFQKNVHNGKFSAEYFVPDGHPNAKGYHLMARNIFTVLHERIIGDGNN